MNDDTQIPAGSLKPLRELSTSGRYIVLIAAFLGWMFAGLEMGMYLSVRPAVKHFLGVKAGQNDAQNTAQKGSTETDPTKTPTDKLVGAWIARYTAAFLLGAAAGGLIFGWLGDHIGRAKTMGISILWYSVWTGVAYYSTSIEMFIGLRFVACLGIGGMWPTGVALASEAWSNASRPLLAGLIGTSANVGLALMGVIGGIKDITHDDWRWVMLVGASPVFLGIAVLFIVPESPKWLARGRSNTSARTPIGTVFRPPYLKLTILGIFLGTIPLLGGWGSTNWMIFWAGKVGEEIGNNGLKADTQFMRSTGAAIGSLLGGWLASRFGRRATYFSVSLASVAASGYIFWCLTPQSHFFFQWVFALGFVSTIFFGWLPLYLPELFPTEIRATGSGVTFNFGRILAAAGVLGAGALMAVFDGDYAKVGRVTHLIYALGMIVILFAPDTSARQMDD